jgi:hypothetical protein
MPANPISIIAHVEASGTADTAGATAGEYEKSPENATWICV